MMMWPSKKRPPPRWADERVISENREPMHVPLHAHASTDEALARTCGGEPYARTHWVLPLTPAQWLFQLSRTPSDAPVPQPERGFDTSVGSWSHICVPLSWQLDPVVGKIDKPIYTNYRYPIPGSFKTWNLKRFPVPRDDNPVGSYQVTFTLPAEWNGRRVFLQLDGASSNAAVWIDGIEVGYTQDSCLEAEFDVTSACASRGGEGAMAQRNVAGEHTLSVQIHRWCDGSYLEDQDQWWLSGLHRHVRLYSKAASLAIVDYEMRTVRAVLDEDTAHPHRGVADVCLQVRFAGGGLRDARAIASLYGPSLVVPGEASPAARRQNVWRAEQAVMPCGPPTGVGPGTAEPFASELNEAGPLLTGAYGATFDTTIEGASLWSAETPFLYLLVVELRDAEGRLVDCESSWVGLRQVEIRESLLCVNGRPITVRGVNRHDHDPQRGKAVEWADMLRDAALMKSHSFNAVRTSHYPNDSRWLELCDACGLYVVDEANIETHGCIFLGDEGRIAKTPSWRRAFLARFARMVQRDKNHASVIVWSLGNESGYGPTHDAMAAWARKHDPTRPIQYESCGGNACTDIICPMYPSEYTVALLNTERGQLLSSVAAGQPEPTRYYPKSSYRGPPRPVIVCEYAHAMGNSTGNLDEWWDFFQRLPYCQGGFIWDWVDQGLEQPVPSGGRHTRWAYGGDFGEYIHDARFCINGLLGPDRRPHPGLLEAKYVMQPLRARLLSWRYQTAEEKGGSSGGALAHLRFYNLRDFTACDDVDVSVALDVDGVQVASVTVESDTKLPRAGKSEEVQIFLPIPRKPEAAPAMRNPLMARDAHLTVRFTHRAPPSWLPDAAKRVACSQFAVPPPPDSMPQRTKITRAPSTGARRLKLTETSERFIISGAYDGDALGRGGGHRFELTVNRVDGTIGPMVIDGQTVLEAGGGELNLWRAPTENDQGCTNTSLAYPKHETMNNLVWWFRCIIFVVRRLPPLLFPAAYSHQGLWERDGFDQLRRRVAPDGARLVSVDDGRVEISTTVEAYAPSGARRATHEQKLTILDGGVLLLENDVAVSMSSTCESLARVGVKFRVPRQSAKTVRWYGRGPHENYADRKRSALVGEHAATSDELGMELTDGYVYPQSCGARGDVRWLALSSDTNGGSHTTNGLAIFSSSLLSFSLLPSSDAAIARATHPHEVEMSDASLHLSLDHLQMGVGGDTGWLRTVRPRYRVPAGRHRWALVFAPLWNGSPVGVADMIPTEASERLRRTNGEAFIPVSSAQKMMSLVLPDAPAARRTLMVVTMLLASVLIANIALAWPENMPENVHA